MARLTDEQRRQLASWNRQDAQKTLRELPQRLEKSFVEQSLQRWGIGFLALGGLLFGINLLACLLPRHDAVQALVTYVGMVLGLLTFGVGFADLYVRSPRMLWVTAILGIVNGITLLGCGLWIWGPLLTGMGIVALCDVIRMGEKQKVKPPPMPAPPPVPVKVVPPG